MAPAVALTEAPPLVLSGRTPLAAGKFRDTYAHPDDAGLVIKIVRAEAPRSRSEQDANTREFDFHTRVPPHPAFPKPVGSVKTDLGDGLVAKRIAMPPPFGSKAGFGEAVTAGMIDGPKFLAQISELAELLIDAGVYSACLSPENVAVIDGRIVSFDTKVIENKTLIDLDRVPPLRRMRLRRRYQRRLARYREVLGS